MSKLQKFQLIVGLVWSTLGVVGLVYLTNLALDGATVNINYIYANVAWMTSVIIGSNVTNYIIDRVWDEL